MKDFEPSDYFKFWEMYLGYDFRILNTGEILTKGQLWDKYNAAAMYMLNIGKPPNWIRLKKRD